jgi:hypothetical protein
VPERPNRGGEEPILSGLEGFASGAAASSFSAIRNPRAPPSLARNFSAVRVRSRICQLRIACGAIDAHAGSS